MQMAVYKPGYMNEADTTLIAQVRSGDYERFIAIQLARPDRRAALYAITALAIELDHVAEVVREPLMGHIRLAWWRESLEGIAAGKAVPSHPTLAAVALVLPRHPQVMPHLLQMVEARAADFEPEPLMQDAAWMEYLDGTAGALHAAWAEILGVAEVDAVRDEARRYTLLRRACLYSPELFAISPELLREAAGWKYTGAWPQTAAPFTLLARLADRYEKHIHKKSKNLLHSQQMRLFVVLSALQVKFLLCLSGLTQ